MSSYSAYSGSGQDQIDPFDASDSNIWRKAEYLGRYLFAADFLDRTDRTWLRIYPVAEAMERQSWRP